ncbi:MAG: hypothetical protein OXF54_04190 [Caldilineaceae bacterium]|nr:hypothetical protein [Caldilineaceae bacterium]
MSSREKDVYGPGFNKAKRLAMARSGGKCQFCGLRKASEGHHWAWPDYPSDEKIQGHDLTALCTTCHKIATMLRDWVERKDADFDQIASELESANNFYQQRKAFTLWLFPAEEKKTATAVSPSRSFNVEVPARVSSPAYADPKDREHKKTRTQRTNTKRARTKKTRTFRTKSRSEIENELDGYLVELGILRDIRADLKREMDHSDIHVSRHELEQEYASLGRQMGAIIGKRKRLQAEQKKMSLGEMTFLVWLAPIALVIFILILFATISG